MPRERILSTIMFTDIEGFTSLMQKDEENALDLRFRYKQVVDEQHAFYKGKNLQYFGDGSLSLFDNVKGALDCAITIQKIFKLEAIPVRIGLHVGDVIIEEAEILGDSVNITSRIESFALTGSVFVSDAVYDQLRNQSETSFKLVGKFRLKNVDRTYEIYAVDREDLNIPEDDYFIGKGDKLANLGSNVPLPKTPILGREDDVSLVINKLEASPIVTITGPGGMGKTRLSLEVCKNLNEEYKGGIAFVSMATISDVNEVMPTLAAHLEIHQSKGRSSLHSVADLIGDNKALIVLDNLEQVISASNEVAELSELCPKLKIICTSRTPLKISSEVEISLQSLSTPTTPIGLDSIEKYPSIQLFNVRAKSVNKLFEINQDNIDDVCTICRRLDGLPLALELAAARIKIMSPEQLRIRLGKTLDLLGSGPRDLPDRHQALRSTIKWSFDLLNNEEKQLFQRLSVFSNGFALEAVENVCYINGDEALKSIIHLESLIDKGLLEHDILNDRFRLLQTIRDYGWELLNKSEEFELIKMKHASYFQAYAGFIGEGSFGKDQEVRLKLGNLEEANFNSALDYWLLKARNGDDKSVENGLLICGQLWMFWHMRGKNISANDYINAFFAESKNSAPSLGKCSALISSTVSYWITGDFEESLECAKRENLMAKALDDDIEIVKSLISLTMGYIMIDIKKSVSYIQQSIELSEKIGNTYWSATSYYFNGVVSSIIGDLNAAEKSYKKALELILQTGDWECRGGALGGLAMVNIQKGNFQDGMDYYEKSIVAFTKTGDWAEVARLLSEMSWALISTSETERSKELTLESIKVYQEVGSTRGVGISMLGLAAIESLENRHYEAVLIAAAADGFAQQTGIVNDYGYSGQDRTLIDKSESKLDHGILEKAQNEGRRLSLKDILERIEKNQIFVASA